MPDGVSPTEPQTPVDQLDPIAKRKAELAKRLAALSPEQRAQLAQQPAAVAPVRTIGPRENGKPVPLSFAQELLYRLERANPGFAYNVPRAIRLSGILDENALQRALNTLAERHEALRTTFDLVGDEPAQIVNEPAPVTITHIDVGHVPVDEREKAARAHMRSLARTVFDLSVDRQLRAWLIRLADDDNVLFLLSHHVSSDGWSGNIIMRELTALYDAYKENRTPALPPVSLHFGDFAAWQRKTLAGDRLDSLLQFWRDTLADLPPVLNFPTDRARAAVPGFEGALRAHKLPLPLLESLREFAKREGATPFMVLLSTLYLLIHRYSGDEEMAVGTPIAGRSYPELEGVVGFFSNTLLIRGSLAGNPTFRELLARVRASALAAFDHQDIPLETLLMSRGRNDGPLATMPQFVLSTEDPNREKLNLSGTKATGMREAFGATKFDFLLSAAERPDGLQLASEYRVDLFDASTIDRILQHFGTLLEGALANPDAPVASLPILTERERQQVFVEWNDSNASYPENATIHSLIEAQVRRRPDAVALEFNDTRITYRELDERASRIAWNLIDAGAKPDDRIALCLERTPDMVACILGVLKAGAAYLPIDPAYPDDRIEFTVQDAGARLLIVDATNRDRLEVLSGEARILNVHEADNVAPHADAAKRNIAPTVEITPDNMAYVIYTSGSTGRPKGVMVEHRNVTRLLYNDRNLFDFNEQDVWTVFHSFSFDFSVWEMYGALMFGGRAVIVPRVVAQSPADFLTLLESSGTTVLNQVPSAFYSLMDQAVARKPNLKVRYVIFGGEALKPALLRPWRNTWPATRLINMFGITETTVHVTFKEIGDAEIDAGLSNIGRPIPTLTTYILDQHMQPVPIGVAGEICVGGLGVARGYLNRPELSAERFVRDPFRAGGRLYKSGDLGRLLPNGEIEYLGRRDHQVKLRGHRIELGEIEAALVQHEGVSEAVAMVREDTPGDQRLVAYIVAAHVPAPTVGDLRDWVRLTLPEVMVPAFIVFVDRIPLTSNGKADRKALPVPHGGVSNRKYVSPRSTIEHELAQIWERLLDTGRPVGVFDDFFEIGGHSMLAIRMLAEVERMRGQRVSLAWLFEASTIACLATKLNEQLQALEEPPVVVLQAKGTDTPVAFVHGDWTGGGWYSRRLAPLVAPDSPFYVLPTIGDNNDEVPWTIERMATRHVAELRHHQPHGPYRVVGFCVGGIVAYEMARQLQNAGEKVERLVLIDSSPVNAHHRTIGSMVGWLPGGSPSMRLERQARMMKKVRWAHGRMAYFNNLPDGTKSRWIVEKLTRTLPRMLAGKKTANATNSSAVAASDVAANADTTANAAPSPVATAVADEANRDVFMLRTQAIASSAYVPGRFTGRIDLLFAEGTPGRERRNNPLEQWRALSDDVRLRTMPTGHIALITSHLHVLAETLKGALND